MLQQITSLFTEVTIGSMVLLSLCIALVIYLLSKFGFSEQTYEAALEERRKFKAPSFSQFYQKGNKKEKKKLKWSKKKDRGDEKNATASNDESSNSPLIFSKDSVDTAPDSENGGFRNAQARKKGWAKHTLPPKPSDRKSNGTKVENSFNSSSSDTSDEHRSRSNSESNLPQNTGQQKDDIQHTPLHSKAQDQDDDDDTTSLHPTSSHHDKAVETASETKEKSCAATSTLSDPAISDNSSSESSLEDYPKKDLTTTQKKALESPNKKPGAGWDMPLLLQHLQSTSLSEEDVDAIIAILAEKQENVTPEWIKKKKNLKKKQAAEQNASEVKINELSNHLAEEKTKVLSLQQELQKKTEDDDELHNKLKKAHEQLNLTQSTLVKANNDLKEQRNLALCYQQDYETLKNAYTELNHEKERMNLENKKKGSLVAELNSKLNRLEALLGDANAKLQNSESHCSSLTQELKKVHSSLETEKSTLRKKLKDQDYLISTQDKELQDTKAHLNQLNNELQQLYKKKMSEVDRLKMEKQQLAAALEEEQGSTLEYAEKFEQFQKANAQLQEDLNNSKNKIVTLTEEITNLNGINSKLTEEKNLAYSNLGHLEMEAKEITLRLAEADRKVIEVEKQTTEHFLQEKDQALEECTKNYEAKLSHIENEMREESTKLKSQVASLNEEIVYLKKKKDQLQEDLDARQKQVELIRSKSVDDMEVLHNELWTAQQNLAASSEQASFLQQQIEEKQKQIECLEGCLTSEKQELESATEKVRLLQQQNQIQKAFQDAIHSIAKSCPTYVQDMDPQDLASLLKEFMESLEQTSSELLEQNIFLGEQIKTHKQALSEGEKHLLRIEEMVRENEEKTKLAQQSIDQHTKNEAKLLELNASLKKNLEQAQLQNLQLRQNFEKTQETQNQLMTSLQKMVKEFNLENGSNEEILKDSSKVISLLSSFIRNIQEKEVKLLDCNCTLEAQVSNLKDALITQDKNLEHINDVAHRHEKQLKEVREKYQNLLEALEDKKLQVANLETKLMQAESERQRTIEDCDKVKQLYNEMECQLVDLQNKLATEASEKGSIEIQYIESKHEMDQLKLSEETRLSEIRCLNDERRRLLQQHEDQQILYQERLIEEENKRNSLLKQLHEVTEYNARLLKDLSAITAELELLKNVNEEISQKERMKIEAFEKEKSMKDEELNMLKNEKEKILKDFEKANQEISNLKQEMGRKEEEIEKMTLLSGEEIQKMKSEKEQLEQHILELQENMDSKKKEIEKLTQECQRVDDSQDESFEKVVIEDTSFIELSEVPPSPQPKIDHAFNEHVKEEEEEEPLSNASPPPPKEETSPPPPPPPKEETSPPEETSPQPSIPKEDSPPPTAVPGEKEPILQNVAQDQDDLPPDNITKETEELKMVVDSNSSTSIADHSPEKPEETKTSQTERKQQENKK